MQRIRLQARLENLETFLAFVRERAGLHEFSDKRIKEIELAVEEALVNIFSYAYPEEEGEVELGCELNPEGALIVQLIDTGVLFDLHSVSEPDLSLNGEERPLGGLGLFLIRTMMDEVSQQRQGGRNILTLTAGKRDEPLEQ